MSLLLLWACGGPDPATPLPSPVDDTATIDTAVVYDPLSMPQEPTLSIDAVRSAEDCIACHPDQYRDWSATPHAGAMSDPVFRAAVELRQSTYAGAQDPFCVQCHSVVGVRSGEVAPDFAWEELSAVSLEGVTCVTCHQAAAVVRTHNAGLTLDLDGPMRGPIGDPVSTAAHASAQDPLATSARLCGACHDVIELSGLPLERPYAEWTTSPAGEEDYPCQACHMPLGDGAAATGGPRRDLHSHTFIGTSLPLDDSLDTTELQVRRTAITALLDGAANLSIAVPHAPKAGGTLDLLVTVQNNLDCHNFPTGSTFAREVWLELRAADATGAVLYETGTLDEAGDLRGAFSATDPYGDADLLRFSSTLLDVHGDPVFLPWLATEMVNPALQPLQARTFTLFVPTTPETIGPIEITARLRFRDYGPYLLRALGLGDLTDRLEIWDVDALTLSAPLDPG